MAENETRNFALRDAQGDEIGVFTGKSPRQAALKAANRGYTDIKLRERGTLRRCMYSQARGCRWISPRAHRPGCQIRSGSLSSRRLA